jgi:hypothetical protein
MSSKIERVPKSVHGCLDRQNDQGLWMVTWKVNGLTHHSRASDVWAGVKTRCSVGTMAHVKGPSYIGVTNGFADFQEFADWCSEQPGYMNRDHNGMIYEIDKDLLIPGNRIYRPGACSFVPRRINSLFTSSKAVRGPLPVGVSFHKSRGKFSAYCNTGSRMKYLGLFLCPLEAHRAWQIEKAAVVKDVATEYGMSNGANHRVVAALVRKANSILEDAECFRETVEV